MTACRPRLDAVPTLTLTFIKGRGVDRALTRWANEPKPQGDTMAYAVSRVYSGCTAPEEVAGIALKELAPKLSAGGGLTRYAPVAFSDGRVGSFSVYESQDAAKRSQQIAAEFVKGHNSFKNLKLDETIEGEVISTMQGSAPMSGRLHGVSRIYTTSASVSEVMDALKEASDAIRSFPGLARYTVVKLTDGRVGIFNSFDSQANARKSSEEAKSLRAKSGTLIARVLPSDPQKLEGTVVGVYPS